MKTQLLKFCPISLIMHHPRLFINENSYKSHSRSPPTNYQKHTPFIYWGFFWPGG